MAEYVELQSKPELKTNKTSRVATTILFYFINFNLFLVTFSYFDNWFMKIVSLLVLESFIFRAITGPQRYPAIMFWSIFFAIIILTSFGFKSFPGIFSILVMLYNIMYSKLIKNELDKRKASQ